MSTIARSVGKMSRSAGVGTKARTAAKLGEIRLSEELEFLRVLWLVSHAMQGTSHRMVEAIGLTGPQRLVLRIVATNPGVSAGETAQILHLHPSTLTGIFQRLQARKLLERRADRADGRRVRLHVTAAGELLVRSSAGTLEQSVKHTLARWSRKQVALVKDLLADFAQNARAGSSRAETRRRGPGKSADVGARRAELARRAEVT